jgi:hypothetical protein
MNNKLILIKERFDLTPVSKESADSILYFTAPVAVFGEKNNNQRVYEESNYLPLLEELHEKISTNNLTGELDHPGERLEVFLSNVSHKIEELKYDKAKRTVTAKIRLIEGTVAGNNAIALHKAGVTLGISSRAIGVIKESKAILKKIITFDIVSTPGFKSALLKPINESLGYDVDSNNIGIYEITDQKYLNKYSYLLENDNQNENKNQKNDEMDKELAKELKDSLDLLKSEIKSINERMDKFAEYNQKHIDGLNKFASTALQTNEDYTTFKEKFITYNEDETKKLEDFKNKFIGYNENESNKLNDFVEKFMIYNENESNKLNKFINDFINYNKKETEKLDKLNENVSLIEETMDTFMSMFEKYSEEQSTKLNAFVEHQHSETQKLNAFVDHQDEITEKLNAFVEHQHSETEKLNAFVDHQDEITEKLNAFVEHQHSETEKLNDYMEYQHNETQKLNLFVENYEEQTNKLNYVVEFLDNQSTLLNNSLNVSNKKITELSENVKLKTFINKKSDVNIDLKNISESVETVLENARKQKAFKNSVLSKYPFLQLLSEERQQEFLKLDDTRKTMIIKSIEENEITSESDIVAEWKKVIAMTNDNSSIWLINAPKDYQNLWESLDAKSKTNIVNLAAMREFKTQNDVDTFWTNLKLTRKINECHSETEFDAAQALKEVKSISENWKLGYSKDYVNQIKEIIKKNKY